MRIALQPIHNLRDGARTGTIARVTPDFEDSCRFVPVALANDTASLSQDLPRASVWTRVLLETLSGAVNAEAGNARPVGFCVPGAALKDRELASLAASGVSAGLGSAQEFVLEVTDAALVGAYSETIAMLEALSGQGFRLGLDATRSWSAPMGRQARALFDTVRVSARPLFASDAELLLRLGAWNGAGAQVIAEGARWRDADALGDFGIVHAVKPRADA